MTAREDGARSSGIRLDGTLVLHRGVREDTQIRPIPSREWAANRSA
ncbi:hypothetical protein [Streptomyces venezuelae]|nr:hypothetical protein [Streptomyces venezuelae]